MLLEIVATSGRMCAGGARARLLARAMAAAHVAFEILLLAVLVAAVWAGEAVGVGSILGGLAASRGSCTHVSQVR